MPSPAQKRPTKGCGKRRFHSELDAKIALMNIQFKDSTTRPKMETRAYRCILCHAWHLTSQPDLRKSDPHD